MAQRQKQPFETTLQDLVYSVDAGKGLQIIRVTLFVLFIISLVAVFTARQFRGFDNADAMDYAQLGRNLARSNRYITQCIRPLTITQVSAHTFDASPRIEAHPELFKPPAYPALLAGAFKFYDLVGVNLFPAGEGMQGMRVFPAEQWVIIPLHHFFTCLSALMIFLLGRKLFSNRIGVMSVVTYVLSEMVWQDSIRGTAIPILSFFVLSSVYFAMLAMIHRRERRPRWNWLTLFMLSLLFSTAAFLTHYAALAMLPGLALFIWLMGSRTQRGGHMAFFYLFLFVLLVSPWLLRNQRLSGSPFGLAPHTALVDSAAYPGDSLMRTLKPQFSLMGDIGTARAKWIKNFSALYQGRFVSMGGGVLVPFFIVTFFYRFVRVHVHNLRWGLGLSAVLLFGGACFFGEEALRTYHIFWPFAILYGLAFFSILLDRLDLRMNLYRMGLTGLVIGLSALPLLLLIFLSPPAGLPYPPYHVPFVARVCELLKPNEVICTDMPWATAWYGQRTSVLLPQTIEEYYEISDYKKYISALYITTITKDRPFVSSILEGPEKSWMPIMLGRLPKGFVLDQGFSLNKQDQLFLTDSVRWMPGQVQRADAAPEGQPAAPQGGAPAQ